MDRCGVAAWFAGRAENSDVEGKSFMFDLVVSPMHLLLLVVGITAGMT